MNKQKKKIFVVSQHGCTNKVGGAITIFINFCNMLIENGYEVYGICSNIIDGYPIDLNKKVKFINLYYKYKNQTFSQAINNLSRENRPDLYVFFFAVGYVNSNLSEEFDAIPRILMLHSRPDYYFIDNKLVDDLKKVYKNTTSQILFDSFYTLLPDFIKNDNVVTIPNFVKQQNKTINTEIEHKKIIYLSRVTYCKGIDFLINSFKIIADKYKDWIIDIYGQSEPPEYINSLINLIKRLNLDKQIIFKGITNNPTETFLEYDFCVFPSYFEGFPMGLIEAQTVGLPCIGLKKCSGVNELIIDDYNGYLTEENYEEFAFKIEKLILDKNTRNKFSENALKTSKKYDSNFIFKQWLDLIEQVINKLPIGNKVINSKTNISIFPMGKILIATYVNEHNIFNNIK